MRVISFGTSLPGVQHVPGRTQAWEAALRPADIVAAAQLAERAGYTWVSACDHVAIPASRGAAMGTIWYDAGSTLAFVAGATTRVRLLSHVLVLSYRHPLVVAKQYGTLDHLSGGRVILGVGSGHVKPEFRSVGADFERRGLVSDEYLAAIAAAWEQEVARFDGTTVSFRDVVVAPRPAQRPRPPLWVGGNSRAALRRAARFGDGWVPWEITPQVYAESVGYARELRSAAGRTGPFEYVAPLGVAPDASAAAVLEAVAGWQAAGATALHVGVVGRNHAEYLTRLEWLGHEVMPAAT